MKQKKNIRLKIYISIEYAFSEMSGEGCRALAAKGLQGVRAALNAETGFCVADLACARNKKIVC